MSQENVEIVRSVLSEFAEMQKLSELVSRDLVWDMEQWSAWPGRPVFHGHDGLMEFFTEWTDAYDTWTNEFEDFTDAGEASCCGDSSARALARQRLLG